MMKKRISANLYQKCLILCRKILLNVRHNMSLTVWLPWQHTGFQTSPILKAFLATFGIPFWYLQMVPCLIQQAYKYISSSLWPHLMFCNLKITNILNSRGDWKRVSCHGNRIFYSCRCVSCGIISLPSFNGLCCKLTKIALFIYLI